MDGEIAPSQYRGLVAPWQPGQSGNPLGRPKGARNKLGEAFIEAMHDDFQANGIEAIQKVRQERPHEYLKVIASMLPKELHVTDASLGEMSDDDLIGILATLRSIAIAGDRKTIEGRVEPEAAQEGAKRARGSN